MRHTSHCDRDASGAGRPDHDHRIRARSKPGPGGRDPAGAKSQSASAAQPWLAHRSVLTHFSPDLLPVDPAGSQGFANVSHGCVNAAPDNAAWFHNFSLKGDLINVINYVRPPELDQDGTTWSWPWHEWVAGDALAGAG